MDKQTLRRDTLRRLDALRNERSPLMEDWRKISSNILPHTGRFLTSERNRKLRRMNRVPDSSATRAVRTLTAGLMSGMTSPARPWFKLATADAELNKSHHVKLWLDEACRIIHAVFHKSGTYRALHTMYEELALYGTAASVVTLDFQHVIHHTPLTAGEFFIATNWRGEVDTLYREFERTVAEVVGEFGRDAVSPMVRNQFDAGNLDAPVALIHAIEPRLVRRSSSPFAQDMPWRSVYLEQGSDTILRESGFRRFPALCPRWQVSGGDIYGTSPAMEAMGDVLQLQHEQLRKAEAIDYQIRPPLQVPITMKNREQDLLPGGIVYHDGSTPVQSIWQVQTDPSMLLEDIQDVRARIRYAFYADLFLMVSQHDTRMTATEVAERHEEKMLMIGPVLERLQNELIMPLVDLTFDAVVSGGMLPPPPQELQGMDLDIELVSILAQAQKAIQSNTIDRFVGQVANLAQLDITALDRLDVDALIDEYGDALGAPPAIIRPREKAEEIRAARAEAQAQQQQQMQVAQVVDSAQKLGNTPMGQGSALDSALEGLSGYN